MSGLRISDTLATISDIAVHMRAWASTINGWADQSLEGGWSTHQVKANRSLAAAIHGLADDLERAESLDSTLNRRIRLALRIAKAEDAVNEIGDRLAVLERSAVAGEAAARDASQLRPIFFRCPRCGCTGQRGSGNFRPRGQFCLCGWRRDHEVASRDPEESKP